MSAITGTYRRDTLALGLTCEVVEDSLERVNRLLAGFNHGVINMAVGSAIKRALSAGKTAAKKAVTQEYTITQQDFLRNTGNVNHFMRNANGSMAWEINYAGYVIPLLKFKTRLERNGRVQTQVKRSDTATVLQKAFKARIFGHEGIWERQGAERFPVRELYGPATTQMMYANEDVLDMIDEKVVETYSQRIEHEINAFLNGWR